MNNKTLHIIQVLAKIGKILSKIIAICCIIGMIGCIVGIVSVSVCGFETFKIGGVSIHSMIEKSSKLSIGTLYTCMTAGLILCICEGVIAKMAEKYFKNELAAGTPFTLEGAREMKRLGIYIIAFSIGALVIAQIAYAVMNHCFADVADMKLNDYNQVGTGIAFIIVSFLCKYGAECSEKKEETCL